MQKILVIQQKMIGDVLLSTIVCEALKTKYPNSEISYVVNTNTIAVVDEHPCIHRIIEFKTEYRTSKLAFFNFLNQLRKEKYDIVVDAYGKLESNLMTLFTGAKTKISYNKNYTKFIYNKNIERKAIVLTNAGNAVENRLRLVFNENEIAKNIIRPKIYLSDKERNEAEVFLKANGVDMEKPIIMISVLGSALNKSLPFEYMAKVIDDIVMQTKAVILLNYIPNQKSDVDQIYKLTTPETKKNIHLEVYAPSLRKFLGVLSHCNMLIGNEGGAVNMAKALEIPTFTVFSPWIKKDAWNMFDDGLKHDSVHLNDFKPEFYNNINHYKELKDQSAKLYMEFTPELIKPKLIKFLSTNNKS